MRGPPAESAATKSIRRQIARRVLEGWPVVEKRRLCPIQHVLHGIGDDARGQRCREFEFRQELRYAQRNLRPPGHQMTRG
jgi:hypothetical protein